MTSLRYGVLPIFMFSCFICQSAFAQADDPAQSMYSEQTIQDEMDTEEANAQYSDPAQDYTTSEQYDAYDVNDRNEEPEYVYEEESYNYQQPQNTYAIQQETIIKPPKRVADTGLDLRVSLATPLFWGASATDGGLNTTPNAQPTYEVYGSSMATAGFGVNIQVGYRLRRIGLAIEQLISSAFSRHDTMAITFKQSKDDVLTNIVKKGDAFFLGATFFVFKEYINFTDRFVWSFGEGVGAIYSGKGDHHMFITNSDASFAVKGDMAFTYYIMGQYGVGLDLDFIMGMTFEKGVQFSYIITPMLVYNMIFDF